MAAACVEMAGDKRRIGRYAVLCKRNDLAGSLIGSESCPLRAPGLVCRARSDPANAPQLARNLCQERPMLAHVASLA